MFFPEQAVKPTINKRKYSFWNGKLPEYTEEQYLERMQVSKRKKSGIVAKKGRRMVTLLMILFTSCIYKFRLVSMVSASVLSIVLGKCSIQVTFCCKTCCEHPLEVNIPWKKVVFFSKENLSSQKQS